jgi:imidazolonepropionase-like amidohydrolase
MQGHTGTAGQTAPSAAATRWAITNARIHPVTSPTIERGTIVIRGTKIEALGADLSVPAGATTLDAKGADVYPGWINARTSIGLAEPGPRGFDDVNEMLDFNPELKAIVAYHADSDAIPIARANGVTTAAIFPSGGVLGGQVGIVNLDGWTWEEAALRSSAGVTFQFPSTAPARSFFGPPQPDRSHEELEKERDQKLDRVARLLDDARAYAKLEKAQRRTDWALEALLPIVERRAPLFTAANREEDIRDAIAFADRVKVRMVLTGGQEAALVAPLLKEKEIPVIVGSIQTLPSREDMFHAATYQLAGELAKAGVKVAFATGDNTNVRLLPYHAALSVAWGMPREEALKALTINAAEILGIEERVGGLAAGKDATLFIAKGDPLEVRTQITDVVIAGRRVEMGNKHEALFERFMGRP